MSRYSNPPVSDSNAQTSPLAGFKFSTIGQPPSLLERMNVDPNVSFRPLSSDPNTPQDQNNASPTNFPPNPSVATASFERGRSAKPLTHRSSLDVASKPSSPLEPPSNVKLAKPLDHTRPPIFPDLQYPNSTPQFETPRWGSPADRPQHTFVDQDAPRPSHPPVLRNQPSVSVASVSRSEVAPDNSTAFLPSSSSRRGVATFFTELERVRKAIESLFGLASVREERMSKQRQTFDIHSSELSTFIAEALRPVQQLHDKSESLKRQAEEMRIQAEQTREEANKMCDMADRLIASAGTFGVDTLGVKNHVDHIVDRVEQMSRFVRDSFDALATLRGREQDNIAVVQAEIAEQDRAERARRQEELRQQLEHQKTEEQEALKRAEEEQEAARKRAEESEATRKRLFDLRRAEVMAEKWRATEAHSRSIQAVESERRMVNGSKLAPGSSVLGFNASPGVSPDLTSESTHSVRASMPVTFASQFAGSGSSQSPLSGLTGVQTISPPLSRSPPPPNKAKTASTPVSFVPAQTEAGRAVNMDLPLSSTTLASELHARNVVEAPQHSHLTRAVHNPSQEQGLAEKPRQAAPTSEPHEVQVKRELFAEALPAAPQRPLPDIRDTEQAQHNQQVVAVRTTSQDRNTDPHPLSSSNPVSHAASFHVTQIENHSRRSDMSGPVPFQDGLRHPQNPPHDRVPSLDGRAHRRQDSVSTDRSVSRWNLLGPPSPSPIPRGRPLSRSRSPSRSPPYPRKRLRSRPPMHYEARQAVGPRRSDWPRVRPRFDDHRDRYPRFDDRARQADTYRPPPRRTPDYRSSHSPPPSPWPFRNGRSPPRRTYRGPPVDSGKRKTDDYWTSVNARHHDSVYEHANTHRTADEEEHLRWSQQQRQRPMPNIRERDQTLTPSPRQREALLNRIDMDEGDDRGRERPPPALHGGPNTRRGVRGAFSSGRGRGSSVSGPTPGLLSRMSEGTMQQTHSAPGPSLSDRLQQD
ncbi:hypothetical protein F5148DRAFT_1369590 [Russula earlei]|uniref:Uncharacterized protein n=1 Tax=Russula earlei TaxID=71964 RepID=A0ACC0U245_9AGAM|nr:hypothetical protein F5148DRAFT_1369590 [Russula earlei]